MEDLDRLEEIAEAATPGPWKMQTHQSGTINVIYRTGECWNEYGPGMLYSTIALYNMGAYSDGMTEDGVQLERHRVATHIATFDPPTALALIARVRELEAEQSELKQCLADATATEHRMEEELTELEYAARKVRDYLPEDQAHCSECRYNDQLDGHESDEVCDCGWPDIRAALQPGRAMGGASP